VCLAGRQEEDDVTEDRAGFIDKVLSPTQAYSYAPLEAGPSNAPTVKVHGPLAKRVPARAGPLKWTGTGELSPIK